MTKSTFTPALLRWFALNGRELPWREVHDPYAIWVSEVILQQTRIEQGTGYWVRFMQRFPTVHDLAAASQDQVMLAWQGLGYYSRARHLHAAAQQIVAMGQFPHTSVQWRQLSGVGEYTAAAVASLAFGEPVAAVDGNVYRVLARHHGIDTPINTTGGKRLFQQLAQELLPVDAPAAFNQAMMDLGATVCTPRSPRCDQCPVAATCVAREQGRVGQLPVKTQAVQVRTRRFAYVHVRHDGQVMMRRRPPGDIWQGLWEPLLVEDGHPMPQWLHPLQLVASGVRHVLTHRVLLVDFYLAQPQQRPPVLSDGYVWVDESDLPQHAVPRLVERLMQMLD